MTFIYWAIELTVCEWQMILCRLGWVPSDCIHSHSGSVGLIASEWFYARSSWVPSDHFHSCSGPDLAWQWVSDFMPGPATYLLIILTITLVLLAWQPVSDFMLGSAGCLWLFSLPLWSCWLDSKWVILCQVQQVPSIWLSSLPPWFCWLNRLWVILCQSSLWVPSDCSHSHSGPVGLIASEWFHTRPS